VAVVAGRLSAGRLSALGGQNVSRREHWLVAAVVVWVVAAGSACGRADQTAGTNEVMGSVGSSLGSSSHSSGSRSGTAPPATGGGLAIPAATAAYLASAADHTTDQHSAHFTVTFTQLGTPNGDVEATKGEGDYNSTRTHATMTLAGDPTGGGGLGGLLGGPAELITDGSTVYLHSDLLGGLLGGGDGGTTWISYSTSDSASTGFNSSIGNVVPFGGSISPESFLSSLHQAGEVTDLGSDDLDGTSTQHYRAKIDSTASTEPGDVAKFGGQIYDEDVWIDGDGVVKKVSYVIDAGKAAGPSGLGGLTGMTRITFVLSDVGKPVQIDLPPPDQVTSGGDLSQLGAGLGTGDLGGG
jgi:hypothetical protein